MPRKSSFCRKSARPIGSVVLVSEPRYVPRDFCAEPDSFGKASEVRWLTTSDDRSAALSRAARFQHRQAVRIRMRARMKDAESRAIADGRAGRGVAPLAETRPALVVLAEKMGCSYPRLMRCLRGEVVMRLDDIAWADIVLGEVYESVPQTPADPVPAAST